MARTNGGIIGVKNSTSQGGGKQTLVTSTSNLCTQPGTRIVQALIVSGGGGDCGSSAPFTFGKAGGSGVVIIKEPSATVKSAPGMWTLNEVYDQVKQGIWTN